MSDDTPLPPAPPIPTKVTLPTPGVRTTGPAAGIKVVAVFGAGLMGSGIAQVAAQAGYTVRLADVSDKAVETGMRIIANSTARVARKLSPADPEAFTKQVLSRLHPTTDPSTAVRDADVVIESIVEDLELKQDLLAALDKVAPAHALFATNTSALLVKEVAEKCSAARKERVGGLHFFNPVPVMRLVEVIRPDAMTPANFDRLFAFGESLGKAAVRCRDTPGFIVNKILHAYNRAAFQMVDRGDATFEDVDKAMELGAGYPMGPFKLADYVGLDTGALISMGWMLRAAQGLVPEHDVDPPTQVANRLVEEGHYGRKTGRGFYDYSAEKNKLK